MALTTLTVFYGDLNMILTKEKMVLTVFNGDLTFILKKRKLL